MSPARGVLFELISGRAAWLGQRQAVLTHNLANADTPDFRPQDLKPADFAALLRAQRAAARPGALGLVRTAARHIEAPHGPQASAQFRAQKVDAYETAPSGNAVVIPEQLQKIAQTDLDFQLTTNLYRRYVGMVRTALGVAQG